MPLPYHVLAVSKLSNSPLGFSFCWLRGIFYCSNSFRPIYDRHYSFLHKPFLDSLRWCRTRGEIVSSLCMERCAIAMVQTFLHHSFIFVKVYAWYQQGEDEFEFKKWLSLVWPKIISNTTYLSFVTEFLELLGKNSLRYLWEERPKVSNYITAKGWGKRSV